MEKDKSYFMDKKAIKVLYKAPVKHSLGIPVKSFDSSKKLFVVAAVNQDLRVVFDRLCEHRQWTSVELLFLSFLELLWGHLWLGLC